MKTIGDKPTKQDVAVFLRDDAHLEELFHHTDPMLTISTPTYLTH